MIVYPANQQKKNFKILNIFASCCAGLICGRVRDIHVNNIKEIYMHSTITTSCRDHLFFQIRLNFLPVGHTREDIDAFFGVYSKHLAQMDVYTIEFRRWELLLVRVLYMTFILLSGTNK